MYGPATPHTTPAAVDEDIVENAWETPMPAGPRDDVDHALAEVSSVLWRVRDLLDLLVFKLEEEQLLLAAGRSRWLARATQEVELVLTAIRHAELQRAVEVDALARLLRLSSSPSLRELADAAPEPWGAILLDHRDAFLVSTDAVAAVAESNRELLTASYLAVQETLNAFDRGNEPVTVYTPTGATPPRPREPLFDRQL
jgi:hypothetical protein